MNDAAIRDYLAGLGIDDELARIYIALNRDGAQTMSQLARSSGVERTKIYRRMDELRALRLVELERSTKADVLKAAPVDTLRLLLIEKEEELALLNRDYAQVAQSLARDASDDGNTKLKYYRGPEGMRQMQWNITRSMTPCLTIIDDPIQLALGTEFSRRWAQEMNRRQVVSQLVVSPHFYETNREWYHGRDEKELLTRVETRVIPPEKFRISINVDIWDDVVSLYNWRNGEVFGVEIYNGAAADMQRQLFAMLWQAASPELRDW